MVTVCGSPSIWGHGRVMPEASSSPDGRYVVTHTGYGEGMRLVVLDLDRREVVEPETPGWRACPTPWGWALDGILMVLAWDGFSAAEPNRRLLACVVADGTCHEVAREVCALPRD